MKVQPLLGLLVFGGLSAGAAAQSSVTMFGVVDLSVRSVSNDQRTTQLAQDGMQGSRLGFRGVEDLGGGLKATFWLEGQIGPDTGTARPSFGNGSSAGFDFNRRSFVGLQGHWGAVNMGRDYSVTFWNWTLYDPFGSNGVGQATNLALSSALRQAALSGNGSYGTLVRVNNMVTYVLPNGLFGPGLYGQVQASAGEDAPGNKLLGGRVGYGHGPYDVAVAYARTDITTSGDVTLNNWNIGGSWNFGVAKLSGFYSWLDLSGGAIDAEQDNWYVGVEAPLGQWTLRATYGSVTGGRQISDRSADQWALGAIYNLSRRTAVYATYASIQNHNTDFTAGPTGSALTVGNNSSGAEIGVRHSF